MAKRAVGQLAREYGEYAESFDRSERKALQRIQVKEQEVAETERDFLRTEIALSAGRREIAAAAIDTQVPKRILETHLRSMNQMDELQRSRNAYKEENRARHERCPTLR